MSDTTIYADFRTRRFTSLEGGTAETQNFTVGDKVTFGLVIRETVDNEIRAKPLHIRTIAASVGALNLPPLIGTFSVTLGEVEVADVPWDATAAALFEALGPTNLVDSVEDVQLAAPGHWLIKTNSTLDLSVSGDDSQLFPESFVRTKTFMIGGVCWVDIHVLQTPLAFTGSYERVLPDPPSVSLVRNGQPRVEGTSANTNEVQVLYVPPAFQGTYYLTFDYRTTKLLGLQDGPDEIAAALNEMYDDGEERFKCTNPEANKCYIEMTGPLGETDQPMIAVNVFSFEEGTPTFVLDFGRMPMYLFMRGKQFVKDVPFEVQVEVVDNEGDIDNPEVAGRPITFQMLCTLTQEQITPETIEVPSIDWLARRPARDYVPFTPDQVITGVQFYSAAFGNLGDGTREEIPAAPPADIVVAVSQPGDGYSWTVNSSAGGSRTFVFQSDGSGDVTIGDVSSSLAIAINAAGLTGISASGGGGTLTIHDSNVGASETLNFSPYGDFFTGGISGGPSSTGTDASQGAFPAPEYTFPHGLATNNFAAVFVRLNRGLDPMMQLDVHYSVVSLTDAEVVIRILEQTVTDFGPIQDDMFALTLQTAGPKSAFQAHTHTIGQIVGLPEALAAISERLSNIEDRLPYTTPATALRDTSESEEIAIQARTFVFPGTMPPGFNPELGVGPKRPAALLPAIHDAIVEDYTDTLPVVATTAGHVYQNVSGSRILVPGGQGHKAAYVEDDGYFGSDGRILYPLTKTPSTNSFYPTNYERELFMVFLNEKQLRPGRTFSMEFEQWLQLLLGSTTRMQCVLNLEVGSVTEDITPSPVGVNIKDIVWKSTPLLSIRLLLTPALMKHKFGLSINRSILNELSADVLAYGAWSQAGTVPDGANFALRGRLFEWDTENSVTNARGTVYAKFANPKASVK